MKKKYKKCINCLEDVIIGRETICKKCSKIITNSNPTSKNLLDLYKKLEIYRPEHTISNFNFTFSNFIVEYISRNINKESVILEIGSGSGYLAKKLLSVGYKKYTSIDINFNSLKNQSYCGIKVCVSDINKLPFKKNSFDIVIGIEVIEHVLEPENLFNKIYEILRPKGIFYLRTPAKWANDIYYKLVLSRPDIDIWHPSTFNPLKLKRILRKCGFNTKILKSTALPESQIKKIPKIFHSRRIAEFVLNNWIPGSLQPSLDVLAKKI